MTYELGIIGAGNMAEAIARGVVRSGLFQANQLIAADPSADRRRLFSEQLGVKAVDNNEDAARSARVILLSVKPQQMAAALEGIGRVIDPEALIISIAAGVSIASIESRLGAGKTWRVVRAMPNTPMLVGEGVVAISSNPYTAVCGLATARRIFESSAAVVEVPEDRMDAVTAVSGSGPAYFFFLVEQMVRAATELGLTPEQAHLLATKTALGAAKMLTSLPDSPQELRRKVTSPGGTTQAAITHMEQHGMPQTIIDAIKSAERRGKELASQAAAGR